ISLLLVVGVVVAVFSGDIALAGTIGLIGYAPLSIVLLASLIVVASSVDRRPWLRPGSLLAHWTKTLGRASVTTLGLAIATLVGTIAGTSLTSTDPSLAFSSLLTFLVFVTTAGLLGAIAIWAISGAIDLA